MAVAGKTSLERKESYEILSCFLLIVVGGFGRRVADYLSGRTGNAAKKSTSGGCEVWVTITDTEVRIRHDRAENCTCGVEHGAKQVTFSTQPGIKTNLPGRERQAISAGLTVGRPPETRSIPYVTDEVDIRYRQTLVDGLWRPVLPDRVRTKIYRDRRQSGESRDQAGRWLYGPGYGLQRAPGVRATTGGGLRGTGQVVPRPATDVKPASEDRST